MTDKKVVLVEDEHFPLQAVKEALKKGDFEVATCSGGFDALDELGSQGADLVISATKLSDLSGYQLSCLIKSSDRTASLPVILVSGEGNGHDALWSLLAQADSVLKLADLKGKSDKLVSLIDDLVARSREQGWNLEQVKSQGVLPGSFSSADLVASYGQLVGDLLAERLVARITRNMIRVIEPRKKFIDNYFALLGQLFDLPALGLIMASTSNPWAAFQVSESVSKKSLDELVAKLSKQFEIHKELATDVRGTPQEEGGKALATVEILAVKSETATLGGLVFASTQKKGMDDLSRSVMSHLQTYMEPVMRLLQANQEIESLYQREQYRASTDPLTGLYNLEFLVGFLQQQLLFSYRQRSPVGLVIVDIDGFKRINDEFGYEIGDLVLSSMANKMLNLTRSSDLIARYGGDEFALVLPNTDLNGAKILAEKIRLEMQQMSFVKGPGRKGPRVTISCGCSSFDMEDLNPETILRNAKLALQRAKEGGGNRVSA
ncbi:MAG TPA: GGDEF domain-containing response regulator [Candidatus Obscuribacterales bacterium]